LSHHQVAQLRKEEAKVLVQKLVGYPLACDGHEGYPKAEVTGGGCRLNDVECSTLESRLRPGLFLSGELLDVFGRIGGFNFYWAWLTGMVAGSSAGSPM
jgi:predicted flavoprotein YhiN